MINGMTPGTTTEAAKPSRRLPEATQTASVLQNPAIGYFALLVSLALTGLAWKISLDYSKEKAFNRFSFQASEIGKAVNQRIEAYARILQAGVGLYKASDNVTRAEWKSFISAFNLEKNYPGTQGIGVSLPIQPHELEAHIQTVRAEGFPNYSVRPTGERDLYTSIIFLEPFDWRNQRAFGYDMYSEPLRRAAMDRAIVTGLPSISRKVTLVQETEKDVQAGFLMYVPIYKKLLPDTATTDERKEQFSGFVYAVLRGADLMHNVLPDVESSISLQIFDANDDPESLLYESEDEGAKKEMSFTSSKIIPMYGQNWIVKVEQSLGNVYTGEYWQSTLVAFFGLLANIMLFYFIQLVGKQRREMERRISSQKLEEKNAELQLANDHLEKSNEDLSTFAYSASHDLKSPLRAISNLARFVKEDSHDGLTQSSHEYLDLLQARAVRLNNLLDDMMAYARVGEGHTEHVAIDVKKTCDEVIWLNDIPEQFQITAEVHVKTVQLAESPFRQTLMNLITNSLKHHDRDAGKVHIKIEAHGNQIVCVVSDDGPGIPEALRQKVFKMFQTIKSRDQQEGSGMGLAFVRKLVERHGGEVAIESSHKWARGTSVVFTWNAVILEASSTPMVAGTELL